VVNVTDEAEKPEKRKEQEEKGKGNFEVWHTVHLLALPFTV
jgi:hypothetical protein